MHSLTHPQLVTVARSGKAILINPTPRNASAKGPRRATVSQYGDQFTVPLWHVRPVETALPPSRWRAGDPVHWESQANGHARVKYGVVAAVVAPGVCLSDALRDIELDLYSGRHHLNMTLKRDRLSFVVAVNPSGYGKPELMWPRAGTLSFGIPLKLKG